MSATNIVRARRAGLSAAVAAAPLIAAVLLANPAAAATSPSAFVADDTLTVTGSNAAELLALRLEAAQPGTLQVDFGDDGVADDSFDRGTFSHAANRAQAPHVTHPDQTPDAQDDLLFPIDPDA